MPLNDFVPQLGTDPKLTETQNRVRTFVAQLGEIANGKLVEGKAIGTGETEIGHGLGRRPVGWLVIRNNANAAIYDSKAPDDTFLYLRAGVAATVSLWVF